MPGSDQDEHCRNSEKKSVVLKFQSVNNKVIAPAIWEGVWSHELDFHTLDIRTGYGPKVFRMNIWLKGDPYQWKPFTLKAAKGGIESGFAYCFRTRRLSPGLGKAGSSKAN
ncbi:myb domain protein 3r-3 [Striga asiatica]|uniref:Myb domain protein 3r-3 n=1 Tax=Striga asiatica TaxID=4170 RepID=A0A5A7PZC6_STRAF|nr:myb domain protein 3r-3 [Striga asiatica]